MNTPQAPAERTDRTTRPEPALLPPVDVVEDPHGITLHADLPGVAKDALHLRVEGEQLTIEGDLALSAPAGLEISHAEVTLARYRRTFTLSKELDAERIEAEFAQGVLRVRIPRVEQAQPRRIQVKVGG